MKTPEERGWLGVWLRDQRIRHDYETAAKFHAALSRARIYINLSEYRSLESGKSRRPPEGFIERVATFFGTEPPDDSPSGQGMTVVAAAIDRQTVQITRQADALIALLQRLDNLAAGQKVVAEEVAALVDPDLARRRLAGAQNETPPGHSPRDPAQPSGPR